MSSRDYLLLKATRSLARDLEQVSGGAWSCRLAAGPQVVVVSAGQVVVEVPLEAEFDPDSWPPEALKPHYLEETEADDASEAVADALAEAIDSVRGPWPTCPEHPAVRPAACSGTWVCEGHDLGPIGELLG